MGVEDARGHSISHSAAQEVGCEGGASLYTYGGEDASTRRHGGGWGHLLPCGSRLGEPRHILDWCRELPTTSGVGTFSIRPDACAALRRGGSGGLTGRGVGAFRPGLVEVSGGAPDGVVEI